MRTIVLALALVIPIAAQAANAPPRAAAKPQLETLFGQLARAGSPEDAKPIEEQIGAIFLQSGSPSVDLLMTRAAAAQSAGDKETARKLIQPRCPS